MYDRRFYENGGDTMMQPDSSGQGIMQAAPQDMQQGMQQPQAPAQGQIDPSQIKDPNHALEIIIKMLIAQGIPPEQAKQIAMEMIKAVSEGGMQEMSDDRIHARFGGAMHNGRAHYGLGSFFKSVGSFVGGAVKGVVNAVKSVAKSDLGKAALTAAAIYATGGGFSPEGFSMFGTAGSEAGGLLGSGGQFGLGNSYLGQGLLGTPIGSVANPMGTTGLLGNLGLTAGSGANLSSGILGSILPGKDTLTGLGLGLGTGMLLGGQKPPAQNPGETPAQYQARVDEWKKTLNTGLSNSTLSSGNNPLPLFPNNPFYAQRRAEGGRMGYADGGIGNIINQATKESFFGTPAMANGGRMHYGFGNFVSSSNVAEPVSGGSTGGESGLGGMLGRLIEQHPEMFKRQKDISSLTPEELQALLDQQRANVAQGGVPTGESRQNNQGVSEIDYRRKGGFVPPIGVKEKADDIPAMLSNNEFVFTADAVRNAGRGDPNLGAKRMYKLMKHLEAGGVA